MLMPRPRKFYNQDKFQVYLTGSSKDRRKQLRALHKKHQGYNITVSSEIFYKTLNGKRVPCEDANTPRTYVLIEKAV